MENDGGAGSETNVVHVVLATDHHSPNHTIITMCGGPESNKTSKMAPPCPSEIDLAEPVSSIVTALRYRFVSIPLSTIGEWKWTCFRNHGGSNRRGLLYRTMNFSIACERWMSQRYYSFATRSKTPQELKVPISKEYSVNDVFQLRINPIPVSIETIAAKQKERRGIFTF